jgi:hypothetical protein
MTKKKSYYVVMHILPKRHIKASESDQELTEMGIAGILPVFNTYSKAYDYCEGKCEILSVQTKS